MATGKTIDSVAPAIAMSHCPSASMSRATERAVTPEEQAVHGARLVNRPSSPIRPCSPASRASRGTKYRSKEVRQWSTGEPMRAGSRRTRTPGRASRSSVSGARKRKTPWSVPSARSRAATTPVLGPPAGLVLGMNFWAPACGVCRTKPSRSRSYVAVVSTAAASLPCATSVQRKVPMDRSSRKSERSRGVPGSWSRREPRKRL
ncbi:hypothetical protein SMICM17S_13307 [Streptomyces microflavus]